MSGLEVHFSSEVKPCAFCGTNTDTGISCGVVLDHRTFDLDEYGFIDDRRTVSSSELIRGPVCNDCGQYWRNLEKSVGREVSVDEFLIWVISQISKGNKAGKHFENGGQLLVPKVKVWGSMYGDFLQVLINDLSDEDKSNARIVCPTCGELCKAN